MVKKATPKHERCLFTLIQTYSHPLLLSRILYGWSNYYRSGIKKVDDYEKLKPVILIWLLREPLSEDVERWMKFLKERKERSLCFTR